ncbi:MAG: zinc metallopeptidase [Calditrichaeota bacterium]|nr:zinc metallopeptidase [Calditrichota bacterium]MCB9368022.1 zinc metallopeptidase [Calditrichota bacterium]
MFPFFFDWTMVLILPALGLAMWAQHKVRGTYQQFSEVRSRLGMTGQQVARRILDQNGLQDVEVEPIAGQLTDHYHPNDRKVRLSEGIYGSTSLSALAVAAHEVGHALQHKVGYAPMSLRASLVPAANIGSMAAMPLFFIGLLVPSISWLMDLGILFFAGAVIFHLITLPVEFDASRRAIAILGNGTFLAPDEVQGAKKVLNAAAWTYVAAATMSLLQMLRLIILRGSRD